ncbi:unnamed protein product, partial [Ectocarpus sp. 12 AP-2014]
VSISITRSYRLLPVARRLIARSVTSSRVRLTPVARRAASMANELVRAAGRFVRNAMTHTPWDQEPAKPSSNRTLSVPDPSGAPAAARPRVTNSVLLHQDEASMLICFGCGSRRTRLWNQAHRSYQCQACPMDWSGGARVHHRLLEDHRRFWGRRSPPAAAPSTLPAVAPTSAPTGRATGFRGVSGLAPRSASLVRRSPPAAAPSTLPAIAPPTAPTGRAAGFRGVSVAAPPFADLLPMDVDDPTPAATPAHATGFIFGGISAVGTGVATASTAPTPMVVASPTSAAPPAPPTPFITFTANQPGAQFTFGGGAASVTTAAAATAATTAPFPAPTLTAGRVAPHGSGGGTTSSAVPVPGFIFGTGGANGGNGAVTASPAPAVSSASGATVSTAPTPMVVASPASAAARPPPTPFITFTANQPVAQFTFGGGAASVTTAAAATTAATTAPFPAPTLTAGRVAPHGSGGGTTSSAVPVPGFTFGTGGANGGNGAVTASPAPAVSSAFVAPASLPGGVGSTQGTGAAPLPPVGLAIAQGGLSGSVTRRASWSGVKRRRR